MVKISAGLLMYKIKNSNLEVFLIHPGGPFYKNKDLGVWGIPKGERDNYNDELIDVARREFMEETGIEVPVDTRFIELENIRQKNNKIVHAWAFENNFPFIFQCKSNVKRIYNDKIVEFPEADDGKFFNVNDAKQKMLETQFELIERLMKKLNINVSMKKEIKQARLF